MKPNPKNINDLVEHEYVDENRFAQICMNASEKRPIIIDEMQMCMRLYIQDERYQKGFK